MSPTSYLLLYPAILITIIVYIIITSLSILFVKIISLLKLYAKITILCYHNIMKRKFLIELQYDGKNYLGFQKNGNSKTVELEIEKALFKLFNENITIEVCSRTDRGVSAKKFYFAFVCETKLPEDRVCFKLNRFLPKDIQCQNSYEIPLDYILRKNIQSKTYEYTIYTGKHIKPLLAKNAVFIEDDVDIIKMQNCAKLLLGKHNFKSFCNINDDTTSFERTIFDIRILQEDDFIKMYFTADNFLFEEKDIKKYFKLNNISLDKSQIKNIYDFFLL